MAPTTDRFLAQVPLFKSLSKKHLQKVSSLATRINGAPGRVLAREGEIGREFLIVLEGEVEIRRGDEVIATRGAGDYIGEIALIDHRPRTATVVAKTPVVIDVIDLRGFNSMLSDEPEIAEVIKTTAKRRLAELEDTEIRP